MDRYACEIMQILKKQFIKVVGPKAFQLDK